MHCLVLKELMASNETNIDKYRHQVSSKKDILITTIITMHIYKLISTITIITNNKKKLGRNGTI